MKKESRRNFVKKTAVLSTATLATTLPVDAFANVTENKKLKISLVGCGGRGSGAIVQAMEADDNVEIISMADVFSDRIEKSLNGIRITHQNFSEILSFVQFFILHLFIRLKFLL